MRPNTPSATSSRRLGGTSAPIALLDYIGLDVSVAIGDAIGADVPPSLRDLVAEGVLGRKTGRGLYPPEFYVK